MFSNYLTQKNVALSIELFLTTIEFSGLFTGIRIFMGQTFTAGASVTWSHWQRADHSTRKVSRGRYYIIGLIKSEKWTMGYGFWFTNIIICSIINYVIREKNFHNLSEIRVNFFMRKLILWKKDKISTFEGRHSLYGETLFWLVSLQGITFLGRGEDKECKVWFKDLRFNRLDISLNIK